MLPSHAWILLGKRAYVFVKAIPKSPVGKILRRLLVAGDYEKE
jgi:2-furoate---CoA ligase